MSTSHESSYETSQKQRHVERHVDFQNVIWMVGYALLVVIACDVRLSSYVTFVVTRI